MSVTVDTVALSIGITKAVDDYRNSPENFVADYVAPVVEVDEPNGYLPRFGRMNQKLINFQVDPYAPSPRVDYDLSTTEYNCKVHRGAAHLPMELEAYDDTGLLKAANLAIRVDEAIRIEREYELAAFMVDNTNFTNTVDQDATQEWDAAGANPAQDVAAQMDVVHTAINRWPEYGLCSADVGLFLRAFVADIRRGGGSAAMAPLSEVAAYLGLKELRMGATGYDSAAPGLDSVAARMYGTENFWIFCKPENPNQYTPMFMATARYKPLSNSRVWTVDDPEGIMVEVRDCYDLVEVDETAAVYFYTVF